MVVVISEFGRTFHENGDQGHRPWPRQRLLGDGRRRPRRPHRSATTARSPRPRLNQSRDYPVLIDYRGLFGGLFRRMYGLDAGRLQTVFPSATPVDLNLV